MVYNFSDFKKRSDFVATFQLKIDSYPFMPVKDVEAVSPSASLTDMLEKAGFLSLNNEQIIRESVIFPVLLEVFLPFKDKISLFASTELKVESENESDIQLNGQCDYIFSGVPWQDVPDAPFVCVVETKKQDFEIGTWQCGAELYACRLKNEAAGFTFPFYFGCVTTGHSWNFIKLEGNLLTRDKYYYTLGNNLPQLLGAWRWALNTQLGIQTE